GGGQRCSGVEFAELVHGLYAAVDIQRVGNAQRAYRLEHARRDAFIGVPGAGTIEHVFHQSGCGVGLGCARPFRVDRPVDQVTQINVDFFLNQDTQHTQRRTTQGERVFGTGRNLADAKQTDQAVETVGQCDQGTGGGGRQCVTGEGRHVLFNHGGGDVGRFTIVFGVVFAGQALHFGEFTDHAGDQIVFAQVGGALHHHFVGTQTLGDSGRQRADAAGFIGQRAQTVDPPHVFQFRETAGQWLLAVGIPEEGGVGQARTDYLFVTGNYLRRVFRLDVGDGDEVRHQLAVFHHVEVFLVFFHGRHQRFRRYAQEGF